MFYVVKREMSPWGLGEEKQIPILQILPISTNNPIKALLTRRGFFILIIDC